MLAVLDCSVLEITNCKKGTAMATHMAKHRKKAARHQRAARPVKGARGKKPTRAKKPVAREDQLVGVAAAEHKSLEPGVVDQLDEALGAGSESVEDVVAMLGVAVVSGVEGIRQSDESELTVEFPEDGFPLENGD
jgi:hypothetical protein